MTTWQEESHGFTALDEFDQQVDFALERHLGPRCVATRRGYEPVDTGETPTRRSQRTGSGVGKTGHDSSSVSAANSHKHLEWGVAWQTSLDNG